MTSGAAREGVRPTIKDVAAAAGVSTKTVSRVLHGERYVGAGTRERVEAAAAALGFRMGPARAGLVAVFFEGSRVDALPAVLAGVEARCAAAGIRVAALPFGGAAMRRAEDAGALVDALQPAGAILLPPLGGDDSLRAVLDGRGVRVVLAAEDGSLAVRVDGARAGAVMTRHLLALGHRRIGFVGAGDCERGHRAALAAAAIDAEAALFVGGGHDFAAGARAGAALLELAEPPTAVFAASDTLAAGVLTAVHARGLRVPEDISVAGFGDEALAAYVWPPLTTVRVSARALGEEAADLLLGQGEEVRELVFELVERASVIGIGI